MPKRKLKRYGKKRPFRKRRRRVRRRRFRRRSYIGRQLSTNGFPKTMVCKHRYYTRFTMTPPSHTGMPVTRQVFTANCMFDPDYTSSATPDHKVNHQPMGHDEISQHYKKYTVIGSKITLYPGDAANNGYYGQYGISVDDDPNYLLGKNNAEIIENGGKFSRFSSFRSLIGGIKHKLTHRFSTKKFFKTKSIMGQSEYFTQIYDQPQLFTPAPEKKAYFVIWCGNTGETQTLTAHNWYGVIEYVVVWHDPVILAQS